MSGKNTKTSNPMTVSITDVSKEDKTMNKKEVKEVGTLKINLKTSNDKKLFETLGADLDSISSLGFEVGVIGYYLNGGTIPSYTTKSGAHVPSMSRDGMSITDIVNHECISNKARSTVSRMVGAVRRLTEDKKFNKFASGELPFTYDKIYLFYDNKDVMTKNGIKTLEDAFKKSVRDLKDIVSKDKNGGGSSDASDAEEMVEFTYNRKKYNVKKSAMESFLKNCVKVTK